jgi:hypothetical protein
VNFNLSALKCPFMCMISYRHLLDHRFKRAELDGKKEVFLSLSHSFSLYSVKEQCKVMIIFFSVECSKEKNEGKKKNKKKTW